MFSTVACNATPGRHLCYVRYITPFPRNCAPKGKKDSTANVSRTFDLLVTTLDALPLAG